MLDESAVSAPPPQAVSANAKAINGASRLGLFRPGFSFFIADLSIRGRARAPLRAQQEGAMVFGWRQTVMAEA